MMKKLPLLWKLAAMFILAAGIIWCIPGMKFSAAFCVFLAALCALYKWLSFWGEKSKCGKVCKAIFLYGLIAGFSLLLLIEGYLIYRGAEEYSALDADAVIVLGAGVNGENPSLVLWTIINTAREYIENHPDIPIVLSGGQGPGEDITEAEAMRRTLEETGAVLLLEERSTSTEENLAFSKEVLKEHGVDAESARVAIVTNGFHVTRACMLAYEQGYSEVFGIGAPLPWWLQGNYYLREAFALIKDMIF